MQGTVHLIARAVAAGLACVATACASPVTVGFADRRTLSGSSTWAWRPDATPTVEAGAIDEPVIRSRLNRLIEEALQSRGFERARRDPDIFLTYHLAHRRLVEVVYVPLAPYYLSSHHGSASYWVEGSTRERRVFREVRLALVVTHSDGRTLWLASVERRVREDSPILLDDMVGSLIQQLPGGRVPSE